MAAVVIVLLGGPAWAQQEKPASEESKRGPVVRTFGGEGGYRTEVTSETKGSLSEDDRRQVAVLTAQVFQHIDEARQALDADDPSRARQEVDKGRQALMAIRAIQPVTAVRTRTKSPAGKVVYEDERDIREDRVPLFEGMIHARTLAPIVEAKRGAAEGESAEVKGVRVVGSDTIRTEAFADLGVVEAQLERAAKVLQGNQADDVPKALAALLVAQVQGVEFRYNREDTPLAEARDAIWLARRSLEENNAAQALLNLRTARERLRLYREVASPERRAEVDQMLKETDQLDGQLHRETPQNPASRAERARQGTSATHWWEQINGWFKKHF
jgi:hypothetical protein